MVITTTAAASTTSLLSSSSLPTTVNNNNNHNNTNMNGYRRKTSLSINDDFKTTYITTNIKNYAAEDVAQQPAAKCIKVFNGLVTKENKQHLNSTSSTTAADSLQLSQVVGGGSLVVRPSFFNAVTNTNVGSLRTQKILMNGSNGHGHVNSIKNIILNGTTNTVASGSNELGRLPGGAELNILPSNGVAKSLNGITSATGTTTATAFYHANGKLTLVNGGAAVGVGGNSSILLKDNTNALGVGSSSAAITPIIVSTTTQQASSATNHHHHHHSSGLNGINSSTNFAQLLAATSVAPQNLATVKNVAPVERLNGKTYSWSRSGTTTN